MNQTFLSANDYKPRHPRMLLSGISEREDSRLKAHCALYARALFGQNWIFCSESVRNDVKAKRFPRFLSLCFLLLAMAPALNAEVSPETCLKQTGNSRLKSTRALIAIEDRFRLMEWHYLKHWETVYHPLYQARRNQREILSEKIRTEADVLYRRYLNFSQSDLMVAHEEWKGLLREMAKLRTTTEGIVPLCPAPRYQNCFAARLHEIQDLISSLKQWLQKNHEWNENFSVQMMETLKEGPSDHDRFEFRFKDQLEDKRSKMAPLLLRHLRSIQEKLDYQWPGEECCQSCTSENLIGPADPVFQHVKPSYQGHMGVSGTLMNRTDLVNAFDEFDLEKETKDKMREA